MLPAKDKKEEPGQERDGHLDQDKHLRDHKLDSASTDRLFWSSKAAKDVETVFPGCDEPLMSDM